MSMKERIIGIAKVVGIMAAVVVGINMIYDAITNGDGTANVISAEEIGHLHRAKFDGHVYIIRKKGYCGGMVHDPDCPCGKH